MKSFALSFLAGLLVVGTVAYAVSSAFVTYIQLVSR